MTSRERSIWFALTGARAFLALFDLVGILAIGFVATSTALFLTAGSDPNRVIEFAGVSLPAVNAQSLPAVFGGVLMLFLLKALLSYFLTKRSAFFVARIEARASKVIAEVSFGGDLSAARKRSREEVMFAVQGGSPAAFNTILNSVNSLLTELTLFVIICLGFFFIDPLVTLAAIAYFALIAAIIQYFVGSLVFKAGQVSAAAAVKATTAISDLLAVFRELSVLGKREKYIDVIFRAKTASANSSASMYFLTAMPRYIIEAALLVGVTLFVLAQLSTGDIVSSAGVIGVFLSGGFRLTAALLPLQSALLLIKSTVPAAKVAHDILDGADLTGQEARTERAPVAVDKNCAGPLGVRFTDVTYSYPESGESAVADASFEIEPGSQVALMGASGAGKSTIADMLCGVLRPSSGRIERFSISHNEVGASDPIRIGYVPQKPGLVSGTIADNVALGEDPSLIDKEAVLKALELANLGPLLQTLPGGIDNDLGKLQDGLSGGQLQRLGLARALYKNPNLLVMDEATSALDAESESAIQEALTSMRGKVTVVLIAHRLNTIQHADKVFLIEEGKVKDSGKFKDLIRRNPAVEKAVELMRIEED
jgi:ABC-type multidrug transport system fused ATPase/permease subunit